MNSNGFSRRQFVKVATVGVTALAGGGRVLGATRRRLLEPSGEKPLYCFPLLGDLHYDKMEHHDLDWVRKEHPGDERQMVGYSKTTAEYTPGLFENVAGMVKAAGAPVPFVIQVGDLVEGLCGSKALAAAQMKESFAFVEGKKLGAPFVLCKGNHDITGPGANEAFEDTMLPWVGGQIGKEVTRSHYTLRQGDDLFVFFDCYKPDLKWVEETLEGAKARQVFFVTHQPVVPYNARANWICFGGEKEKENRAKLVRLLGKHKAIVLSGHLHKYSLLTRTTDGGQLRQLAVCSVARRAPEAPKEPRAGKESYSPALLELEPKFSPNTLERRKQLIEQDQPFVTDFDYADAPGYAMVKVYKDRVETEVYLHAVQEAWKKPVLATLG